VPAGKEDSVTIAATLDSDVGPRVRQIQASATIQDDGSGAADANRRNNSALERTPVVHLLPDLTIAIDDGDAGVAPGEQIVYSITYANEGAFDATGVTLTIELPSHTMLDEATDPAGWNCSDDGVCTLTVGNLAAGTSKPAEFVVTVDPDVSTDVRHIYATASITDDGSAGADLNPRNNRASERIAIKHKLPDIKLQVSDGDASVAADGSIVYTFEFTNVGTADATGAEVQLRLPRYTSFSDDGSSEGWLCEDGRCTFVVGDLDAGESRTATLVVTVDAELSRRTRQIYMVAGISDDGSHGRDADTHDNYALEWTPIARG
jgi:uncharacterized repeat protein (TIGR01451 family)